ncbi:MAG: dihydropteroate synthase [Planctomycetota bacterium]|nr:dihydropteroate synthase [Planctomycetota bacterium]
MSAPTGGGDDSRAPRRPSAPSPRWTIGPHEPLALDQPRILAIVNVTPDSFSDGGELPTPAAAAERMLRAQSDGAAIIDMGGESTRPGAARIDESEQIRRIVPALRAARAAGLAIPVSIDTTRAAVARAALDEGAAIINDVSAGVEDPAILELAARRGSGLILMHRLRPPDADSYSDRYTAPPAYPESAGGVVGVVRTFLSERVEAARAAGVNDSQIVLDPGLGFGKAVADNLLLARSILDVGSVAGAHFPVLSAASRKSFLSPGAGDAPRDRDAQTLACSVVHALMGVRLFRVHDVRAHARALRTAALLAPAAHSRFTAL